MKVSVNRTIARHLSMVLVVVALLPLFACSLDPPQTGVLEGHVTIGPLVPVVREGEAEPTPSPEVYATRQIVVFREDGNTEVARLTIDANGDYRTSLPVGTYWVDINHAGIDSAAGLPSQVVIVHQEVTRLDIDIDTGIR
jgi:hypothetical protein